MVSRTAHRHEVHVDGRYRATAGRADYFGEYALMKMRVTVECEYLIALSETNCVGMRPLTAHEKALLRALPHMSVADAQIIKKIEREGHGGIPATNPRCEGGRILHQAQAPRGLEHGRASNGCASRSPRRT